MYSIFAYTMSLKNPLNTPLLRDPCITNGYAPDTESFATPVPPAKTLILGAK